MTRTRIYWALAVALVTANGTCRTGVTAAELAPVKSTVHVGDGTMDGSSIKEYDNLWLVTVRYADGRVDQRGLSSDHVRFRDIEGKRYLTRIEGTTSVVGKPGAIPTSNFSMTFNAFEPMSLRPFLGESHSSAGDSQVRHFNGTHVSTRSRASAGDPERVEEVDTAEAVFDTHGGMTGLLLAALPLNLGYEASLPGIDDTGLDATTVRVVGEQEIPAGHIGKLKTWVVEIGTSPALSTYWISKAPPYVIRVTVKAPNAVAYWDML